MTRARSGLKWSGSKGLRLSFHQIRRSTSGQATAKVSCTGTAGAGWVGVEDERTLDSQPGREGLALRVPSTDPYPAAVVRDRFVKELGRGKLVAIADRLEAERSLERVADIHRDIPDRFAGFSHGPDPAHNCERVSIAPGSREGDRRPPGERGTLREVSEFGR